MNIIEQLKRNEKPEIVKWEILGKDIITLLTILALMAGSFAVGRRWDDILPPSGSVPTSQVEPGHTQPEDAK